MQILSFRVYCADRAGQGLSCVLFFLSPHSHEVHVLACPSMMPGLTGLSKHASTETWVGGPISVLQDRQAQWHLCTNYKRTTDVACNKLTRTHKMGTTASPPSRGLVAEREIRSAALQTCCPLCRPFGCAQTIAVMSHVELVPELRRDDDPLLRVCLA